MEYHAGVAREIFPKGKKMKHKIKWLKKQGYEIEEWEDDYICSDTVTILFGDRFFTIDDRDVEDEVVASKQEDGSFTYNLAWYNGGGGFDEVLESAIGEEEKTLKLRATINTGVPL